MTILDYIGSVLRDSKLLSIDFQTNDSALLQRSTRSKIHECLQFIHSADTIPQIHTRLLIVEDLGQSLINLLGATFNLSPEFFEEHLYRLKYRNFSYPGPSPLT